MDELIKQSLYFDFYGELLTENQRELYEDVVLNDLSLGEAAEERGISRQGVHDQIKRCNRLFEKYEAKLHLVEKFLHMKRIITDIQAMAEGTGNDKYECTDKDVDTDKVLDTVTDMNEDKDLNKDKDLNEDKDINEEKNINTDINKNIDINTDLQKRLKIIGQLSGELLEEL